ncbi:FGGY family carbohydrate kinase [Actinoplanes sp. Pm04-4]|uniref:FGGY family carbohydrate kinase n=1 Tax=Paractinoplanes pyxinae TaxID=2997416 RepID=A0ABT4BDF1_9ACTN|nr:FGGY family carbohydrate kinase [Actinoplanes pyxinae]MCY1143625.1 FGGY family carbohydrate kinase [Actinoplanes pyxinae]
MSVPAQRGPHTGDRPVNGRPPGQPAPGRPASRPDVVVAVDVGTSAVKALVVDSEGRVLGRGSAPIGTDRPRPGHVEQSAAQWWQATAAALAACGPARSRAGAFAVTGQMQDLVCVGETDAVRPAILYSDTRAVAEYAELTDELGPEWADRIDNEPDATTLPGKLLWLRRHEPAALKATRHVLAGAGGYVVWRATGVAACDLTTAGTTGLLDARRRTWWPPAAGDIELPALTSGDTVTGRLRTAEATELGLSPGIPVVLCPGDAAATTIGLVGHEPGRAYASLGTSGWLASIVRDGHRPPAAHRLPLPRAGHTLLVGAVAAAGSAADWARRTVLGGVSWAEADAAASACGPSGLLALPSLAGERFPLRDPDARATLLGMTATTTAPQMYRAVLESVAFAFATLLPPGRDPLPLCGEAGLSPVWARILADVTDRPVLPLTAGQSETAAAHGAVRTAFAALGVVPPAPLAGQASGPAVEPGPDSETYQRLRTAYAVLWKTAPAVFHALSHARPWSNPCA